MTEHRTTPTTNWQIMGLFWVVAAPMVYGKAILVRDTTRNPWRNK